MKQGRGIGTRHCGAALSFDPSGVNAPLGRRVQGLGPVAIAAPRNSNLKIRRQPCNSLMIPFFPRTRNPWSFRWHRTARSGCPPTRTTSP
ncbi:protein of unknown function (plasmid) [Cupriavidus taiwanensis]|uniref:Uncharacterized protein n=1 Tax=Cupriavidus taiwanensis TaxID=164546 RepID=A0A375I637_9BURK|nr:hypothetical protein CT19425_U350037 [Cupriavidus taiwanensis]SPK74873.1 protein of unknown function [Cupriavidus taiwanensis]